MDRPSRRHAPPLLIPPFVLRLVVHDYAGHPFQLDLSREMARRGHAVLHLACGSLSTTPQASLQRRDDDPETLAVETVAVSMDLKRFATRPFAEALYGWHAAQRMAAFRPTAVLSANTPLDAQRFLQRAARRSEARFVVWLQDLIGEATYRLLAPRLPVGLGTALGRHYQRLEAAQMRRADAVVTITDDFHPMLDRMHVDSPRIHTVENWAPIAEVPVRPQDNPWSRAHDLAGKTVLLYTGTLGMKHNPALLVALAEAFRTDPSVRVVVTSQGAGADFLRREADERGLSNLCVLGFQPFEAMPDVLGSAAVLLAVLEPDAGVFSVPSKVLTDLCAARPVVLAVPPNNLAARLVRREQTGLTVDPSDETAFVEAVRTILSDAAQAFAMGRAARAYAEVAFPIDAIADRFEAILSSPAA